MKKTLKVAAVLLTLCALCNGAEIQETIVADATPDNLYAFKMKSLLLSSRQAEASGDKTQKLATKLMKEGKTEDQLRHAEEVFNIAARYWRISTYSRFAAEEFAELERYREAMLHVDLAATYVARAKMNFDLAYSRLEELQ